MASVMFGTTVVLANSSKIFKQALPLYNGLIKKNVFLQQDFKKQRVCRRHKGLMKTRQAGRLAGERAGWG